MSFGLTSLELQGFYNGNIALSKSIAPTWKFYVTFLDASFNESALKKLQLAGPMPILQHWHILNVEVPNYNFKREIVKYGPIIRSFPVIDYEGFDFNIDFEEDDHGTIGNFINWNQRRIITQDGLYNAPEYTKIDRIIVEAENMKGDTVAVYTFHNCFFMKANPIMYDYSSSNNVKYQCTFSTDWVDSYFPQKLIRVL